MDSREMETVLVVCADAQRSAEIIGRLHDAGVSVVGSAHTAGLALALTAQMGPRSAILVGETAGRRSAAELAEALAQTWGVECIVVRPEGEVAAEDLLADVRRAALEAPRGAPLA